MRPRTSFIDRLFVHMKGGTGGNGLPKLNGIGGKGGDVWVAAKQGESIFRCYYNISAYLCFMHKCCAILVDQYISVA